MGAVEISTFKIFDGSNVKLEYHDSLRSTSMLAKEYAASGYPDKYVVFTERQFSSPLTKTKLSEGESEGGIFLSIILRPSVFPSQMGLLAPLCATALLTALEEHTNNELGISWLGDVYSEGIKIGGAGVEGKLDNFSTFEYMIVSFAVRLDKKNFEPRLTDMIRQVFESDNRSVEMIIAKSIINRFFAVYQDIKNPTKHVALYKQRFILRGKKIRYVNGEKKYSCKVVDVDSERFSLICEKKNGERILLTSPSGVIIPKKIKLKN